MFKRRDKKEKKGKKEKQDNVSASLSVERIGVRKFIVIALWVLLISSIGFGIYNNFTATDTHTVYETEVVKEKIFSTSGIENFVTDFAYYYHSFGNTESAISTRLENLSAFMSSDLLTLNKDLITEDTLGTASVSAVKIYDVEQEDDNNYTVLYTVSSVVTVDEERTNEYRAYTVKVYLDDQGDMVIIKNPTVAVAPTKSDYEPDSSSVVGSILTTSVSNEITDFLETFFKLYPSATETELTYYVENNALMPIENSDLVFSSIYSSSYMENEDGQIIVEVSVLFTDNISGASEISQFSLVLEKENNWRIIERL